MEEVFKKYGFKPYGSSWGRDGLYFFYTGVKEIDNDTNWFGWCLQTKSPHCEPNVIMPIKTESQLKKVFEILTGKKLKKV